MAGFGRSSRKGVFGGEDEGGGVRSGPGEARTILLSHIISARPSRQSLMVRTFLKVYMELGSYFLFQEQIKDIIVTCSRSRVDGSMRARLSVALLENQCGASCAESGGAVDDPSTHDTRPGLRAGMTDTATWPAVAVEELGHSFTPCCGLGKPSGRRAGAGAAHAS